MRKMERIRIMEKSAGSSYIQEGNVRKFKVSTRQPETASFDNSFFLQIKMTILIDNYLNLSLKNMIKIINDY